MINTLSYYKLNYCSQGEHLFCFPRISTFSWENQDSRETKQMFLVGAVIKCFVILHKENKPWLLNFPALKCDVWQRCSPVSQQFLRSWPEIFDLNSSMWSWFSQWEHALSQKCTSYRTIPLISMSVAKCFSNSCYKSFEVFVCCTNM